MRVSFIGDVHANWAGLDYQLHRVPGDEIIQVGDLGFMPHGGFYPPTAGLGKEFQFIEGNHDDVGFLEYRYANNNPIAAGFKYLSRNTVWTWAGVKFLAFGGGDSIDRTKRTLGVDWFPREVPSYLEFYEFQQLLADEKPDVVITHECPDFIVREQFNRYSNSPVAKALGRIYNQRCGLNYSPKFWFYGHHHQPRRSDKRETTFVCCPEISWYANCKITLDLGYMKLSMTNTGRTEQQGARP